MLFYPKKVAETKLITRDVSIIIFWLGMLLLIPMFVGIIYSEPDWPRYLPLVLITSGPSYLFMRFFKKSEKAPFTEMTIITLAVTWITFSIVGSYPFLAVAEMNPLDSYFESVASISTAGLTNLNPVESIPHSVLFWRAMLAWFGGIGIVSFAFYAMLQSESLSKLFLGEGVPKIKPNIVNSAKEVFKIYSFWTVVGITVLSLIGIPIFDSFNLSMGAISTTGMDVRNSGWAYYQQNFPDAFPAMAGTVALLMLVGSIGFVVHYRVIKSRDIRTYLKDGETRLYLAVLLIGILIISAHVISLGHDATPFAYEALSTSSTGGFEMTQQLTAMQGVSEFTLALLLLLVLIGGSSGSTAGGLKVRRVMVMLKYVSVRVKQQISPKGEVNRITQEGKRLELEEVANIAVYAFIYCTAILFVSGFLISLGHDPMYSSLVTASAQAGCGISPIPGWQLEAPAKIALIGTMLFGRLEFIPLFALGAYALKRH